MYAKNTLYICIYCKPSYREPFILIPKDERVLINSFTDNYSNMWLTGSHIYKYRSYYSSFELSHSMDTIIFSSS